MSLHRDSPDPTGGPAQVVRFVINGVAATIAHYAVLTALVQGWDGVIVGLANLVAAIVGITVSFVGNRYFVFASVTRSIFGQAIRFLPLYGFLALLHGALLFLWTDLLQFDYRFGFAIAIAIQMTCSFIANKYWVFS